MAQKIVITGARGFVGRNLLEALLKNDDDIFFPICRSKASMDAIIERQPGESERLRFISGDIEFPYCKIPDPLTTFGGEVDFLIHSAADTDFSLDKTEAERVAMYATNVTGTKNVIDLARILKPKRIIYFSTAYASGNNAGLIPDENVIVNNGWKNYYEETKHLARELMLKSGLPFSIINPTIVIGNSDNGDAEGEKRMIYGYLHAMYVATRFKLARLHRQDGSRRMSYLDYFNSVSPGNEFDCNIKLVGIKDTIKNVVPVDQLVNACTAVMNSDNSIGRCYNVGGTELPIGFMLDSMQKALKIKGFRFEPGFNGESTDPIESGLTKELAPYKPYVTISDPSWDDSNLRSLGVVFPKITPEKFDEMMVHYVENYLLKR
jgi:nucleoside-diphosphate-sugar epimerase